MNTDDTRYCQHASCRDHTAEELVWMARHLWRRDLVQAAAESQRATVRCRLLPRKGPIKAPLPYNAERERV